MPGDEISIRAEFRHHDQASDPERAPAALGAKQLTGEAPLTIHAGHQRLHVIDPGLHLDDEQRPTARMPRDDVNRAALAVVAEGVLEDHLPAVTSQDGDDIVHEPGMISVAKPIRLSSVPERRERESNLERSGYPPQGTDGQSVDRPGLRECHQRPTHAGCRRQIILPPRFALRTIMISRPTAMSSIP